MLTEWRYEERQLGSNDGLQDKEEPALCQKVFLLAHSVPDEAPQRDARQDVLVYHVYWGAAENEEPHALRRLFARFAGFDARLDVVVRP
jgi:hypothetical protein